MQDVYGLKPVFGRELCLYKCTEATTALITSIIGPCMSIMTTSNLHSIPIKQKMINQAHLERRTHFPHQSTLPSASPKKPDTTANRPGTIHPLPPSILHRYTCSLQVGTASATCKACRPALPNLLQHHSIAEHFLRAPACSKAVLEIIVDFAPCIASQYSPPLLIYMHMHHRCQSNIAHPYLHARLRSPIISPPHINLSSMHIKKATTTPHHRKQDTDSS
jgi:hypothetical protein